MLAKEPVALLGLDEMFEVLMWKLNTKPLKGN